MQRCARCKGIIFRYEPQNPNICGTCFRIPVETTAVVVSFENKVPKPYSWMTESQIAVS